MATLTAEQLEAVRSLRRHASDYLSLCRTPDRDPRSLGCAEAMAEQAARRALRLGVPAVVVYDAQVGR